jgi:DMSO/TMAO reductase YedYZ molybdopterin-dependent catalytic subunit
MNSPVSRGFRRRSQPDYDPARVPPGQYVTTDFPVLSAGPTPRVSLDDWTFTIDGAGALASTWTWEEFRALPTETVSTDIHCVTRWSKLGTAWEAVSLDTLLRGVDHHGSFALAHSYGGYTTNVPLADLSGGRAWIAFRFGGRELAAEHGGPARLLVPHLYFWKSAKWVQRIELLDHDVPGFWEDGGYHMRGDPWLEQRYDGD